MRITFKAFDSKMASREKLFKAAIEFANKLDRKDLLNITHSEDRDNIVITVWYWTEEPDKGAEMKAKREQDVAKLASAAESDGPGAIVGTGGALGTGHEPTRRAHDTQRMPVGEQLLGKKLELPADDPPEQPR